MPADPSRMSVLGGDNTASFDAGSRRLPSFGPFVMQFEGDMTRDPVSVVVTRGVVTKIWEDVSERVGDDLRVVTWYDAGTFETRMRDDVRAMYTADEDRTIVDDTIVTQLGFLDTENAYKSGTLGGIVRIFDDAWILSWIHDRSTKSGVVVSIQRNGETASMDDVEWVVRYLDEEIAPRIE